MIVRWLYRLCATNSANLDIPYDTVWALWETKHWDHGQTEHRVDDLTYVELTYLDEGNVGYDTDGVAYYGDIPSNLIIPIGVDTDGVLYLTA